MRLDGGWHHTTNNDARINQTILLSGASSGQTRQTALLDPVSDQDSTSDNTGHSERAGPVVAPIEAWHRCEKGVISVHEKHRYSFD